MIDRSWTKGRQKVDRWVCNGCAKGGQKVCGWADFVAQPAE